MTEERDERYMLNPQEQERYQRLADWAEHEMELDPNKITVQRGPESVAQARAMLEAAGVDVDELNKPAGNP